MKRLLLTFIGLLTLLAVHASGDVAINGLRYHLDTDAMTASLIGIEVGNKDDTIVVPSKVTFGGFEFSVTSFGNNCFYGSKSLTSITIPSSVTSLGYGCFSRCSSLTSITIPSSVTSLGSECFTDCSSLTSITIPSSVTSLGDNCFEGCSSLTSITIPSSVTSLGDYCFDGCSSLASIVIPSSVTSFGDRCFSGCSSLTSITIPSSVIKLGDLFILGCSNLESVYCYAVEPPISKFTPSGNAILYVPAGSVDKYKQADCWNRFTLILPIKGTGGDASDKCKKPVITFSDGKLHFESSTTGAKYHYTLDCSDVKPETYSDDCNVNLAASYNISAYATADDYFPSDKSTATLYWINGRLDDATNINTAKTRGVLASSQDGIVTISGLNDGERVSLYSVDGKLIGEAKAVNGVASYAVSNVPVVIAKIGDQSIKIAVQ